MTNMQPRRVSVGLILLACAAGMGCQVGLAKTELQPEAQDTTTAPQARELVIENDSDLPVGYPHGTYIVQLRAHGSVSELHWRLEKGSLPPGIKLEDNGLLHGQPLRSGEFQFTVSVIENGNREKAVQKGFVLRVTSALTLNWKTPPRVDGSRIEGSVEVSNTSPDDMDLTFVAMAVASNGRATAIGYQHFVLQRGTIAMELPFGETLPFGGYVIHVDAVAEVAPKNLIYRQQLQTPSVLQVTVGP
jgi:hypothetical protein